MMAYAANDAPNQGLFKRNVKISEKISATEVVADTVNNRGLILNTGSYRVWCPQCRVRGRETDA
jgi:hypothetical protein